MVKRAVAGLLLIVGMSGNLVAEALPHTLMEEYTYEVSSTDAHIEANVKYYVNMERTGYKELEYDAEEIAGEILDEFEPTEIEGELSESCVAFTESAILDITSDQRVVVYVCAQLHTLVTVTSNADFSDTRWVIQSMLQNGVPVTPWGFDPISKSVASEGDDGDYYIFETEESVIHAAYRSDGGNTLERAAEIWIPFHIQEGYETLEVETALEGVCNLYEGDSIPQKSRKMKPRLLVYICVDDGALLHVASTGTVEEVRWVVLSILEDGVPVAPFGYVPNNL